MSRLLILSCSQRKRPDPDTLPAIERYDGPAFRVLRRYLRETSSDQPDVHILSSRFGLIASSEHIPFYDQRMSLTRAQELMPSVSRNLRQILSSNLYSAVFVSFGLIYSLAIDTSLITDYEDLAFQAAKGTSGRRIAQLYDWLHGAPPEVAHSRDVERIQFRGVDVMHTVEEVLHIARQALQAGRGISDNYQAWYVAIDSYRVAPKWLVSQLTGLPVGQFTTSSARRLLAQLGIQVKRI